MMSVPVPVAVRLKKSGEGGEHFPVHLHEQHRRVVRGFVGDESDAAIDELVGIGRCDGDFTGAIQFTDPAATNRAQRYYLLYAP